MRILDFTISNYKSFRGTPHIKLSPGFNVIVGRNNAGKSALLEALSLRFEARPHRSLITAPHPSTPLLQPSRVNLLLELDREELVEILTTFGPPIFLPLDSSTGAANSVLEQFLDAYHAESHTRLSAAFENGSVAEASIVGIGTEASFRRLGPAAAIRLDEHNRPIPADATLTQNAPTERTLPILLAGAVQQRIYAFRAERMNVGETDFAHDPILLRDASNLPRALNHLQTNTARHRKFNEAVRVIFPDVTQVTVEPTPQNRLRILVWTVDPDTERGDLAMPLSESGTGIGQVLAMLYVVMTAEHPRIIAIDEPQSFLHPGAVRKLFEVLRREALYQHQYVITTHSPAALSSPDTPEILLIRKDAAESRGEPLDWREAEQARVALAEVGARLADVFGVDDILWVEGPTEERCFPVVLRRLGSEPLYGTAVLGVRSTGDLEGKHAELAFDVYRQLSKGGGVLPPAVAFVFDHEGRSEGQKASIARKGGGSVYFLPRRMYENYLLVPTAIADAINRAASMVEGFEPSIAAEQVERWLEANRWRDSYFDRSPDRGERTATFWVEHVHGAKLLEDLFNDLTEARLPYDKTAYAPLLTEAILGERPQELQELADFLDTVLKGARVRLGGHNGPAGADA